MLEVIAFFLSGIIISRFIKLKVERSFILLAYTLIFFIGAEVGSEVSLLNLTDIIVKSVVIAASTLVGTMTFLLLLKREK